MELLRFDSSPPASEQDPVLLVAIDGWTDAGEAGSSAARTLHEAFDTRRLASFDPDALYDYRDRRPELEIDQGILGALRWPELVVDVVTPPSGPQLITVTGAEPDLSWQTVIADLRELVELTGIRRHVGLGAVPGPIPHTRPVHIVCTGSDVELIERLGRAHEHLVVPASCQVVIEKLLAEAGVDTLGMWARIPHYVAGTYPQATRTLLERLSAHLGTPVDLGEFDEAISDNRTRLDLAAASSDEVSEHVRQLERLYDAEAEAERITEVNAPGRIAISEEEVPSADEIAAEIERFLRGRSDDA